MGSSKKKLLKRLFSPKPKNARSPSHDVLDSDDDEASSSASPNPSFEVPTTSIQKLFPNNNFHGLGELYSPDNAVVDIVFLHGLNGRADRTFFYEKSDTFWPTDLLAKDIDNARIFTYGYDANVAHFFGPVGQNTLQDHASNLVNRMANKRLQTHSDSRKIIFVAHSLGGLVTKRALALSENSADEHLRQIERDTIGIVFLGTPHRGADMAPFAKAVANILKASGSRTNPKILEALKRDSEVLAAVEDAFSNWLRRASGRFQLTCFSEEDELPGVGLVVKPESAKIAGWPNQSIKANHMDMAKFPNSEDDGYLAVSGELRRWIQPLSTETHTKSKNDIETILLAHLDKIGLTLDDVRDTSKAPGLANEKGQSPGIEDFVEWFIKSPEFQVWRRQNQAASLWLYGPADAGKTVVMSYILQENRSIYTMNWDIAVYFCSEGRPKSEDFILISIIFQLIKKKDRSGLTQATPGPWNSSLDGPDMTNQLWRLLEAVVSGISDKDTVFLFDGIDILDRETGSAFLRNLLHFEKRVSDSGVTIRVLISSRPEPYIQETLAHYASIGPEKERKECLRTLYFQEWDARETRVDAVDEGGDWLVSHPEYSKWIESPESDLLWIEGKPGSGKSTLLKRIVQKLQDENNVSDREKLNDAKLYLDTVVAAFFYSFRGGITETSHELMLRSLVYQIWSQNKRLFPLLQDTYRRLRLKNDNIPETTSFWRYEDLKCVLGSLHKVDFPLRVFVLVDGVDESDSAKRGDSLRFLDDLSSKESNCVMKVLIVSRPEVVITNPRLGRSCHIVLQKENAEDIRKVVEKWTEGLQHDHGGKLLSKKSRKPDNFSEIGDYIIENSQGVFLWVSLVLRDLERLFRKGGYTIASLENRVRKLPKDLGGPHGFYRAIVDSLISRQGLDEGSDEDDIEEDQRLAKRILAWVTFPKRPISMRELEHVLATPLQIGDVDLSTYDLERNRPLELERGLIAYCGGLVEVRDTSHGPIVQLIHQTVREFILDQRRLATPYDLDEVEGDQIVSKTCCFNICVTFMAAAFQVDVDPDFSRVDSIAHSLCENNLLLYSLYYFMEHFKNLGDSGINLWAEFESHLKDTMSRPRCYAALLLSKWVTSYWPSEFTNGISQTTAENCLQSAFVHAAANGKEEALKILLVLGADINGQGRECTNALQAAARQGHRSIVKFLLRHGADVNARDGKGGNAFQAAACQNHLDIVKTLVEAGSVVNGRDDEGNSAFWKASYQGHDEMVLLLRRSGADIEARNDHGNSALWAASYQGHNAVVSFLLDYGVRINAQNKKGATALQTAAHQGHLSTVKILLDQGADINVRDRNGNDPLWAASSQGHNEVVQLLLEKRAALNALDQEVN
ncbi:uncharacterized protein F4822DRAFT_246736 [Hypoxylon trugodes]|uniref:uncharacterized protein n=1 Tax=Hypoxylon trugodes TaxID=326681 RepID=UPI0021A01AF1|nr:uncharacterized protein F4822DRAFT_246736 [Hypoxylon trugodes]KAI1388442.1 hypothetical protein F4822DRAFT_246736 [Hypoxylon trugodes]